MQAVHVCTWWNLRLLEPFGKAHSFQTCPIISQDENCLSLNHAGTPKFLAFQFPFSTTGLQGIYLYTSSSEWPWAVMRISFPRASELDFASWRESSVVSLPPWWGHSVCLASFGTNGRTNAHLSFLRVTGTWWMDTLLSHEPRWWVIERQKGSGYESGLGDCRESCGKKEPAKLALCRWEESMGWFVTKSESSWFLGDFTSGTGSR